MSGLKIIKLGEIKMKKDSCNCNANTPDMCTCEAPVAPETAATFKRVQIIGNAFMVVSKLKLKTIKTLEKYKSNALCLKDYSNDEEKEIFRIGTGKTASISKFGITFAEENKEGFATATMLFPAGIKDKKQFIKDNYGKVLFLLNDVECSANHAYTHIQRAFTELDNIIEEI